MKKFNIGEYVRIISTDEIVRIANISAVCIYHLYGTMLVYSEIENIEHLKVQVAPFKFKETVFDGKLKWQLTKQSKKTGKTVFQYSKVHNLFIATYCNLKIGSGGQSFSNIAQARDWLELQYAIMLVGSRSYHEEA